ncbi:MAG: hypothetical protein R2774_00055 [Saprospiraceae bacterium]
MNKIVYLATLTFLSCNVFQSNYDHNKLNKLTFTVESKFDELPEMMNQIESYIEKIDSTGLTDSFKIKFQTLLMEKAERESKYPNEIYIEAIKDDWQRQRYFENKYTNKLRYSPKKDSISIINYVTNEFEFGLKLNRDNCTYTIEVDNEKRKVIHGYNCYFVKLTEFSGDQEFIDMMGSTVYEMWVTTKINIPIYLVLKNDCKIEENFFPLETKMYQSKSKNNYHIYMIKEIK